MGYRAPISTNPAMVLGGLKEGVTPLEWAYAYMTLANDGDRVSGTLAPEPGDSPVAYTEVTDQDGNTIKDGDNDSTHEQVISEETASTAKSILETVVSSGTGVNAEHRRRRAVGQDGDDGEQRRRLVLRRHRRSHRLRLGRLRRQRHADGNPLQRRPGDGRHVPGADLGQRHLRLGRDRRRTGRRNRRREGGARGRQGRRRRRRRRPTCRKPKSNRSNRKKPPPKPKRLRNRKQRRKRHPKPLRKQRRPPNRGRHRRRDHAG